MTAIITTVDESENLTVIGETLRPLLTTEMGSSVEVYDTAGDEGMGPPPHFHAWSETYVMIDGELDLVIGDGEPTRLRAGMVAHAPGGTTHAYTITANGTRFLTILGEGNGHAFYRQMDDEVSFPPNIEDVVRVATTHGIGFPG
ncbi:MAG: cupin domain-containing protein [Actinomycetota bacterium]